MSTLDHPAVAKVAAALAEAGQPEAAEEIRILPAEVRTDTAHRATVIGATEVGKAGPAFVKEHTGQVIGGVAPVAHPARLRTLVDTALRRHDRVWAAAGHAKSVFPTTFDALLALTGGEAADVAANGQDIHP